MPRHAWLVMLAALSCGSQSTSDPTAPKPAVIQILSGNGQQATASTAVSSAPTVMVLDGSGQPIQTVSVFFTVLSGNGWVVSSPIVSNAQGRASATWHLGPATNQPQTLEARVGSLTVTFTATALRPSAGAVVTGSNSYVEWIPGDLPIIITAPHGGTLVPTEIADRTLGTTTRDLDTEELARDVVAAFTLRFGKRPHLIVCLLHRRKLDSNREIIEAAAGNPIAERAWREYRGFIEASAAEVRRGPGMGFYVDLHGHGHAVQRVELGYLVSRSRAEGWLGVSASPLRARARPVRENARPCRAR